MTETVLLVILLVSLAEVIKASASHAFRADSLIFLLRYRCWYFIKTLLSSTTTSVGEVLSVLLCPNINKQFL